jgi:hypothetical protein
MAYSSIVKPGDYFNTKLYTGNGSTNAITGVGFQPDWVWIKDRDTSQHHRLADAVRGVKKNLKSDTTDAENTTDSYNGMASFDSDGFTLTADNDDHGYNANGSSQVSWNWKAGTGQGSSNTDGSINTTYTSVNTTAGFSISTFTGTGSNATVGHGLGVVPKMMIIKNRSDGSGHWRVYHASMGNNKYGDLDNTGAFNTSSTTWNNTTPTNSVFSIGSDSRANGNGNSMVAYVFADKTGYSKFGSYIGNGNANGAFVYTGFKPAWIMYKKAIQTGSVGRWSIIDNKRDPFNVASHGLSANASSTENTGSGYWDVDLLSNGFKFRTTEHETNGNGETFVYAAFAEEPLIANSGTNGVPATAK